MKSNNSIRCVQYKQNDYHHAKRLRPRLGRRGFGVGYWKEIHNGTASASITLLTGTFSDVLSSSMLVLEPRPVLDRMGLEGDGDLDVELGSSSWILL